MDRFAYVSKFAYMQILLTRAKVYFTMRILGDIEVTESMKHMKGILGYFNT